MPEPQLTERQTLLYKFVRKKHRPQKRRYTGEPYFAGHLKPVAEAANGQCKFGYEIALCHDLLEDTDCKRHDLYNVLLKSGYSIDDSCFIGRKVDELTDIYTHEAFPQLNRAKRKSEEHARLSRVSYEAQTVKCFDLINNCESIVKHDPVFAKLFLQEAGTLCNLMTDCNPIAHGKLRKLLKKYAKLNPITI